MLFIARLTLAAVGAAAVLSAAAPANAQSTTRIETRPFYGATVTLEEGVRVFRPLPVERNVIINPGGETPLTLGINETHVYERRVVKNYNYNEGSGGNRTYYGGAGAYGFAPGFGAGKPGYGGHHGGGHHGGGHGRPGGYGGGGAP